MSEKRKDSKGRVLRNGESQRTDGKYQFRYTDSSGQRITIYSWKLVDTDKVPAGKKCEASLRELEKNISLDAPKAETSETLNDLFDKFIETRSDLRIATRNNYSFIYNTHVRNSLGKKPAKDIKHSDVQRLYNGLLTSGKLKPSSIEKLHIIVYQSFDIAVMDKELKDNPAANVLKTLRKTTDFSTSKRDALTEEEQSKFIEYVYSNDEYERWRALITVLIGTGLRIGEALGLRWDDCDFDANCIYVTHGLVYKYNDQGKYAYRIEAPKTKAGKRIVPMLPDVKETLLAERQKSKETIKEPFVVDGYTNFIFINSNGKVYTPAAVYDKLQEIRESYNRDEQFSAIKEKRDPCFLPKFSAHILRHSFCTRLVESEVNLKVIQSAMGHRSINTTMDVYADAAESKKQADFLAVSGKIKVR